MNAPTKKSSTTDTPTKRSSTADTLQRGRATRMPPQSERKCPQQAVYDHYDQSYWLMQAPDQTSNKAIFHIFPCIKRKI